MTAVLSRRLEVDLGNSMEGSIYGGGRGVSPWQLLMVRDENTYFDSRGERAEGGRREVKRGGKKEGWRGMGGSGRHESGEGGRGVGEEVEMRKRGEVGGEGGEG